MASRTNYTLLQYGNAMNEKLVQQKEGQTTYALLLMCVHFSSCGCERRGGFGID